MVNEYYIPEKGDLIWISFHPHAGIEQSGRRPAFVLTPYLYNKKTGLCILCTITSKIKGYPFEVKIPSNIPIEGVILCDRLKSLDYKKRNAQFVGKLSKDIISQVIAKIILLIDSDI